MEDPSSAPAPALDSSFLLTRILGDRNDALIIAITASHVKGLDGVHSSWLQFSPFSASTGMRGVKEQIALWLSVSFSPLAS